MYFCVEILNLTKFKTKPSVFLYKLDVLEEGL